MQELFLGLAVTASILVISSVKSPKLRASIYSLPIPITIILLGTGIAANSTHLFSLILVILFMFNTWLLYKKLPIVLSITIATVLYVVMGLINQYIVKIPFVYTYLVMIALWLLWVTIQPLTFHKTAANPAAGYKMRPKDYMARGGIVFGLTYILVGFRELILGAAVTFPFNGIFTAYIMKDQLLFLVNELVRNFLALMNFFATIYLLQAYVSDGFALMGGWLVCVTSLVLIHRYLPRKQKEEKIYEREYSTAA